MSDVDLAALRERWVGEVFDLTTFTIDADKMVAWAEAVGETDPRFLDPENEDFQAHPNFTTHCLSGRVLPEDFPQIGGPRGIDGGKAVEIHRPIRAGDELRATTTIADIYDKTGRSGTMVFIVQRMSFVNQRDEPVATVDWRMIRND
ncbi:MAG: MaoC family dehydratase N-terminal domain-containing protein [Acidimicrobiales bacterium]